MFTPTRSIIAHNHNVKCLNTTLKSYFMVTSHVHVTFKTNYTLISNVKYSDFPINMMKISHSRMTPPLNYTISNRQ